MKYEKVYFHDDDRWWIELDPGDPDTPAMVYFGTREWGIRDSATYGFAVDEGILSGDDTPIPRDVLRWLETFEDDVDRVYEEARKDIPEYNE